MMAKIRPIQKTFKAGEVSPKFLSAVRDKEFVFGCELLQNYVTTPYGTVQKRTGSELISEISDDPNTQFGRIFTFRVEGSENYIISVTEDQVTVHDRDGNVTVENLLPNAGFNQGKDFWNTEVTKTSNDSLNIEPRVSFLNGVCSINSGNAAKLTFLFSGFRGGGGIIPFLPYELEQGVNVTIFPSDAELTTLATVNNAGNDHSLKIVLAANGFSAKGVVTDYLSLGTTEGDDDIPFTIDPNDSSKVNFIPGAVNFWISYKLNWDDSVNPSRAGRVGSGGNIGSAAVVNIDAFSLIDETAPANFVVTFSSPWTDTQINELQVEKAPGLSRMYFVVRAPFTHKKLEFDRASQTWTFEDVDYQDAPPTWAADGYPGSITFFQGRMWLAGSLAKPATVWGSVSGEDNYEEFTAVGAEDDDALELPLARDGVIQWIQGGKALTIGSDTAEHIIFGNAQFDLLTPANARVTQHSSYGSYRIHAEWLSEKITFVSQDQRRVYIADYDRETFGFVSDELTYMAEHISIPGITEVAYSQNPRAHVWATKLDGEMIGCTYQRETDAIGWHRHLSPFGQILSVTTTEEFGTSVVWLLILRQQKLYLERVSNNVFLDFHKIRQYETPTDTVDGLEHLNELVVDIVADGAYAGRTTIEDGEATIDFEATTFVVGIPYTARMITLPVEVLSPADTLSSKLVRWNRIFVRLLSSIEPIINGHRPPDRTADTPMDTRQPGETRDVLVATTGWDRDGKITIDQDLPFATEIVGVFGELSEDGL